MKRLFLYIFLTLLLTVSLSASVTAATKDASDLIYSNMMNTVDEIDLSAYSLTVDELSGIFNRLMSSKPELFFVERSYSYTYIEDDNIIVSMLPNYKFTGNTLEVARNEYNAFIENAVSGIDSDWSDVEKLLYLHDHLALYAEYDNSLTNGDAYLLISTGAGTCAAYTLTYMALCEAVDIECSYASSDSMNHAWNVVKTDGEWYHVDVTWDDPVPDIDGRVLHSAFLCSDEGIVDASASTHENWISDYQCTDNGYDSAFWKNVNAPFAYAMGRWFAFDAVEFSLYEYDFDTDTAASVASVNDVWYVIDMPDRYYTLAYSGVEAYDNFVYFNSPTSIYSYHIKTGRSGVVYTIPEDTDGYIYYFTVDDGTLTYNIASSPSEAPGSVGLFNLDTGLSVFSVTYMIGENVHTVQYYSPGEKIIPPEISAESFIEWTSLPEKMPASSITVTAVFEKETCKHESIEFVTVTPSTCTAEGEAEVKCSYCGYVLSSTVIEPAHTPGEWKTLIEASCTADGLSRVCCTICGETVGENVLPAISHTFGDWQADASGNGMRICTVCGHTETQDLNDIESNTTSIDTEIIGSNTGDNTHENPETPSFNEEIVLFFIASSFLLFFICGSICLIVTRNRKR